MVIRIPAEVVVPFGKPRRDTIYISGSEYSSHMRSYEFTKRLNQMSSFKASLIGIDSTEKTVVQEDKDTMFFVSDLLQLKGKIKKCDYKSLDLCDISGFGEEVKLWGRSLDRSEWVSSGTDDIVAELCSENLDGGSPWILETGTNMDWGNITIRGHYDDRLRVITGMAKATDYEWWMSTSGATYGTDIFNIGSYRGEPASQHTFVTGSDCSMVFHERDTENLANDITVLGYGDGVMQISGCATDATSISTYGRKEATFIDRSLTDANVAGSVAEKYLADLKDPIERVKLTISEPYGISGLDIGDKVTIIDNTVFPGAGSDFRIVGMQRKYSVTTGPRVNYELSNKALSFVEEIAGTEQKVQKLGTYAKGSTDSFQISCYENTDENTDLNLRFYIPTDVIRIMKANLAFKMKDYRTYTRTSEKSSVSPIVTETQTDHYDTYVPTGTTWTGITTDFDPDEETESYHILEFFRNKDAGTRTIFFRVHDVYGGSYYPNSTGMSANIPQYGEYAFNVIIPGDVSGTSLELMNRCSGTSYSGCDSSTDSFGYGFSRHIHDMSFAISGVTLTSPSVTVSGGIEGSESGVGVYTSDQDTIDVTSIVQGAGSWTNIKFTPNKKMRIEANLYCKEFIESK